MVANTSNTMLNESDKSELSCFVLDLWGNAFSSFLFNMKLALSLSYLSYVPLYLISIGIVFKHKGMLSLTACVLCVY